MIPVEALGLIQHYDSPKNLNEKIKGSTQKIKFIKMTVKVAMAALSKGLVTSITVKREDMRDDLFILTGDLTDWSFYFDGSIQSLKLTKWIERQKRLSSMRGLREDSKLSFEHLLLHLTFSRSLYDLYKRDTLLLERISTADLNASMNPWLQYTLCTKAIQRGYFSTANALLSNIASLVSKPVGSDVKMRGWIQCLSFLCKNEIQFNQRLLHFRRRFDNQDLNRDYYQLLCQIQTVEPFCNVDVSFLYYGGVILQVTDSMTHI